MLRNSANTAYTLLVELLIWAKSQKDETQFMPKKNDIIQIVTETLELLNNAVVSKEISISFNTTSANLYGLFDYDMVKTICRNLLSNAIKFTPNAGSVSIRILDKDDKLIVKIKDSGVGIPSENIEKLFDKKSYITTPDTNFQLGTGIGLSICLDFINKHNEKIWVESTVNQGSTFYFTLPKYL